MIIPIKSFQGEFPRVPTHLLPDGAAQHAQNVDISRGVLSGLSGDSPAPIGPAQETIKSLYIHEGNAYSNTAFAWYAWSRDVSVARGPVVDDQYNRFYWSDGTGFYVSQANIGPYGKEPVETNKWKVGVPKPESAPELANHGFNIPGITSYSFEAFCEAVTGETSHSTEVTPSSDTNTATNPTTSSRTWALPFNPGVCPVGSAPAETPPEAVDMNGLLLRGWVTIGGQTLLELDEDGRPKVVAGVSIPLYGTSRNTIYSGDLFFHWTDWEYAPLSSKVTGSDGNEYHYLEGGWYSTNQNATAPNDGGATVFNATSPAVKVTMVKDGGTSITAIIRKDAGENTWPPELFGYTAELTLLESSMSVTIRIRDDYAISRAYAYSYVNTWGEEGALSDPLEIDNIIDGATVGVKYAAPPAGHGYRTIDRVRIYRTASGSGGTNYLFTGEATIGGTMEFTDNLSGDQLGESAQTVDYLPPPQNINSLVMLPNGILAGFIANEIYLMEPYLPYACIRANIKTLPHNIVSLSIGETGLYALTTSYPYLLSGVTPDSIVPQKIAAIQGGVSRHSVCDIGPYIAYASNDGLVMVRGLDASLDASFKFWTREKWQALYGQHLSSLHLDSHDGYLLGWFDNGTPGFFVRLEDGSGMVKVTIPGATASFVSPRDDALYLANGKEIFEFRKSATRREWAWWSKDYILPKPANMGVLQVVGSGNVSFRIYADGVEIHSIPSSNISQSVEDTEIFRLPPGFKSRRWSVVVNGNADSEVREIYLSETIEELKRV